MVDTIIKLTTALVMVVAIVNLGHAVRLAVRLARRTRQRYPEHWIGLWLPVWRSPQQALAWLRTWRAILGSPDDAVVAAIRVDGRAVMVRHAQLFAWTETWAMLVVLIAR